MQIKMSNRTGRMRRIHAVLLLLYLVPMTLFCHTPSSTTPQSELEHSLASVDMMISWLPQDTESIVVLQQAFELPNSLDESRGDIRKLAEVSSVGPLGFMKNGAMYDCLRGHRISLAVEGSRQFRAPAGLGPMPYAGCHMLCFESASSVPIDGLVALADIELRIVGYHVFVFKEVLHKMQSSDQWSVYIARPRPGLLLVATDRAYLEEVLTRVDSSNSSTALAHVRPEMKYADTTKPFWAIRHYDESSDADPTSPRSNTVPRNEQDESAIGIAADIEFGSTPHISVTYLSSHASAELIAMRRWTWTEGSIRPSVSSSTADSVRFVISADSAKRQYYSWLLLSHDLGHGEYL